jgi:hypothetical protein
MFRGTRMRIAAKRAVEEPLKLEAPPGFEPGVELLQGLPRSFFVDQ